MIFIEEMGDTKKGEMARQRDRSKKKQQNFFLEDCAKAEAALKIQIIGKFLYFSVLKLYSNTYSWKIKYLGNLQFFL